MLSTLYYQTIHEIGKNVCTFLLCLMTWPATYCFWCHVFVCVCWFNGVMGKRNVRLLTVDVVLFALCIASFDGLVSWASWSDAENQLLEHSECLQYPIPHLKAACSVICLLVMYQWRKTDVWLFLNCIRVAILLCCALHLTDRLLPVGCRCTVKRCFCAIAACFALCWP